ncbi:MAG: helix-turn-helix domain-containing protein [Parvibaculum sp.]
MATQKFLDGLVSHVRSRDPEGASAWLSIVAVDEENPETPPRRRHTTPSSIKAVDTGRLTPRVARLHKIRAELGITVRDLAEITGIPLGTINRDFYNNNMPRAVEEFLEDEWAKWNAPKNVARRTEIEQMSMEAIIEDWSKMLGLANVDRKAKVLTVAKVLEMHPLTIERQISGERVRWSTPHIFRLEQKIKDRVFLVKSLQRIPTPAADN